MCLNEVLINHKAYGKSNQKKYPYSFDVSGNYSIDFAEGQSIT